MLKEIKYKFRFPVEQTGEREVTLIIKRGEGPPIIHPDFAKAAELTEEEYRKVEELVIRAIAIVPAG